MSQRRGGRRRADDGEDRDQLSILVGPAREVPDVSLPTWFERQVAQTPERPAAQMADDTLTYAELNARANQLARYLVARRVGPESVVALTMPRSIDAVVAVWGTLKAGAAYLPVDATYPAGRISFMLRDAGARLVLSDLSTMGLANWPATDLAGSERTAPLLPSHPAYVIYTSGSTGRPKAVIMPGISLVNLMAWYTSWKGAQRVAQYSAFGFDVATMEILAAHLSGGCLVIPEDGVRKDVDGLIRWIDRYEVNELIAPTVVIESVCRAARSSGAEIASLRDLGQGGERLVHSPMSREFFRRVETRRFYNYYGPTETHLTTAYSLPRDVSAWPAEVPIGLPIPNVQGYVLDDELGAVPVGETGELYLAGAQLARGYLNRPALTAARFVADPFGAPGERMYRTGDLVRVDADGQLVFVGRLDHQVKVRGFRVELGEIEARLRECVEVAQAVVVAREDRPAERLLVAYVVPSGDRVDPVRLRHHLLRRLPDYMVPAAFVVLDQLPLNSHGKVSRGDLPVPPAVRSHRPPRTSTETILCELFAEVLETAEVGVDDDFISLGGHSLNAVTFVGRVRSRLGVELPVGALFDEPTPARLAALVDTARPVRSDLRARCRRGVSPLSFPQRRLWFLHRLEGPSTVDNIAIKVGLTGDLDRAALAAALRDVVGRHESLRTTFAEIDGEPVQRAHSAADWPGLHVEAVGEGHLEATMSRATAQPFDLATEMPLRATLLVLEADRHVLVLLFHHIAVDGWSMLPLGRDIAEAYCARLSGVPPSWTPLPVQYADFAEWQREAAGDPAVSDDLAAGDLAYWYQALTNLPEDLALPFDHPREGGGSRVRSAVPIRLDPALHQGLVGLARSEGATLFMALHAGVAALLSRLGAGPDIPLGTPAIGRYDERLEDLVGFFVNTLVLRVGTGGDPGFADLIGRVRAADLAAFAHQETPFERLVEIVNPDRSLGRHPLFQVMLALNSGNNFALELPGLDVGAQTLGNVSRFDLNFGFTETFDAAGAPGGIRGDLQYDSHLFTRATAERIAGSLRRLLSAVVRDPTRPLRRILLTSEDERRAALGRTGRVESPSPALVHEMFERQVRRTPHAVAVSAGDAVLTYDELNHNANRLARHLAERGVGPEARVAIVLRPAPELVVAILAVLKAGGAYVPIDADYPADRLRFLLHDSRPELLITTSDLAESIAGPVPSLLWNGWNGSAAATYCGADLIDDERAGHLLPSHPAYVMYTSGSTGQPKGVVVEHRSLSAYLGPARTRYPGVDGATLLHVSISFDATVTSLYLPLISGGRVCIGSLMGQSDRHRDRGTLLKITPSHLDLLESLPAQASPTQGLIVGGEQLSGERLVTWRSRHPEVSVYNSYGPTEATVNCAEFALAPGQPAPVGAVPIGQPLPGARIYLLDSALHLVAPGMIGEMYVTGELIARGYLGQPALTAERFVADPFGPPGTRMYRTGDLARQLPDGNLQFVGRVDGQVKIRGVRIEPREVERALERHGSVRRAAVLAHDFGTRDTRLVAYVTPAPGQQVEPDELRRFAATVLPRHVVPAAVVPVVELPRTAGGKLDRAALPAPEPAAAPGVRPRGPWERQLCEIFADTLGVPVIGVEDPFFDLGGHSLLVPRLVERIRAAFGITLNIRDVFEAPTVAELATRLTRGASGDPLATLLPLRLSDPVNGRAILYCVHSVTGVSWTFAGLLRHLDSDRPVYGLQAPGLSRSTDAPASADELITALVNEICGTARDAPVCLVGWSVGGLIAHMLAVRLQREGRRVGALALLDSYPRLTTEADLVADRAAAPEGSDLWVDAFASIGDLVAGVSGVDHERVDRTLAMVRRLASVRPLGVFQGDVLLFVAADGTDHSYTPEMWAPYVSGSIETHLVDCSHHEMTRPDALAKIGPVLNDRMREVDLR